jgi:hypothetical protein
MMSQTNKISKILKWLDNEKLKDRLEIETSKNKLIQEIKSFDKKELFIKEKVKKDSIWLKIRKMIWGN